MKRHASAHWAGSGKEGKGNLSTQSTVLTETQYSFNTRFADGIGTNPEELIAAAHAGCFSMKLAFVLNAAGITPESIDTTVTIVLEDGSITQSNIDTSVKAEGLTEEVLAASVKEAEINCPVSKLLKAAISATHHLIA
ncbi:MAG: OsmC family peroxiredoxin [Chitinophagaceae bacterium]|nr:OsmC family peroxiredoxin [Chitinophagaceae bacterium]